MVIEVRLFAELKKHAPSSTSGVLAVDVSESILVKELLEELEILESEIGTIKVNGRPCDVRYSLDDGDRIDLLPINN